MRLLIVSTVRWDYLWQRHQALARAAAVAGWDVDYLQPRPRNLGQVASYPFRMIRRERVTQSHSQVPNVQVRGLRSWFTLRGEYDLILVYLPDLLTEALLRRLKADRVVYDGVLDWERVPRSWYPPLGWRSSEKRIAKRCGSSVITDSVGMQKVFERRGISSTVVHPAADNEFLESPLGDNFGDRKDAILYFGSIRAEVDTAALARIARGGVAVHVVGRIEDGALGEDLIRAGVVLRASVTMSHLAELVRSYKVVILPYTGARASTLMPAKYWNALASGAWVVASGIDLGQASLRPPNLIELDLSSPSVCNEIGSLFERTAQSPAQVATWDSRWAEIAEM